ncbi:MAG: ACT domain-containing protein [Clostridia bacterium]|nr:ACT domain-containing protein [Clostridia bacterium]
MAIKQLSVFVENKRGGLVRITDLLAGHGINLSALSIADTKDFGILRLIVDDTEKAREALEANGVLVKVNEVVGIEIPDRTGELSRALSVLDDEGINVEYLYAFLSAGGTGAYVVLRVEDNATAESALTSAGFRTVTERDVRK